ncbi:MAG: hypothetical protein R2822_12715 [Spirosomataceae bacterium]
MPLIRLFTLSVFLFLFFLFIGNFPSFAKPIDVSNAQIYTSIKDRQILLRTIEVLQQEVYKRSQINWSLVQKLNGQPFVGLALESDLSGFSAKIRDEISKMPAITQEGFKLLVLGKEKAILVIGKDARGLLYGVGRLLRKLEITPKQVLVSDDLTLATSPYYPVRGHQLGYRPKTNAYDAFSVAQFDQYIRELALFGANSIEIMPPRTDDDATSRHMKVPAIEMIAEQSRICKEYGLDVWMWYPNMGSNYTHPDSIQKELKERHEVFSRVSKLDHVFVPGGDPGDLEPDVLFAWLKKMAVVLQQHHPKAKIWVSPQVFRPTKKWFDTFYAHVNNSYPWFGGVVFGPWVKMPVAEIRRIVKPSIPIRHYPDITHNYSAQYPIPHWDLAYAITLGRESINPRPHDEKVIHNALDEYGIGSISYSEGTNDDVNKFVWSDQDWNPNTPVIETLRDYARLFFGPSYQEPIAQGILALEHNLQGPLMTNESISRTLMQWRWMEENASLAILQNPRFQMGLIRAYFDDYTYRRLMYETELEQQAKDILGGASFGSALVTLQRAKSVLEKAWTSPILPAYRKKCFALADSLYKSIGAQLTISRHGAMSGRGNFIDNIDIPLNDAPWLLDQITKLEKLDNESNAYKVSNSSYTVPTQDLVAFTIILARPELASGSF